MRKVSFGVGVERTFPVHSPILAKIEVVTRGDVRRAKLYYLRDRIGKAAKIKEKRQSSARRGSASGSARPGNPDRTGRADVPAAADRDVSARLSSWPRPRGVAVGTLAGFALVELGYAVWAAFVAHGLLGPRVGYGPDSAVYLAAAHAPVWSRRVLAGPGPFGFLLVAKLCARNLRAIVLVQSVVAVAAWGFLATTVAGTVRSNVARWVGFAGVLGLALAPGVLQWNAMITTESLSLSTLCAVIASAIRLVERGTRQRAGVVPRGARGLRVHA